MAYIQPTSEVWLCANVPLDPSYDNQLTFTSGSGASRVWDSAAQRAYFASKAVYHPQNYSIVKERDGVLRMSGEVSQFYNINYMYFVNPPFGTGITSKYFYAFVTQVEYVNPNTTFIYFELDYFQTWAADIVWMESVIEREHVEDDRMYKNLEDEGIEVNDMEPYAEEYLDSVLGQKILVVGASESYTQIVEQMQNEGIEIFYEPYERHYPIYSNLPSEKVKQKIVDLKCYSNNELIPYSKFTYNSQLNKIIIMGLEDINIDKITFTFQKIDGLLNEWYVQGIRSGSDWVFSQDGIRVSYTIFDNYPNVKHVSILENINIVGVKNSNNEWLNIGKKEYTSTRDNSLTVYPYIIISGYTPQSGDYMLFDVEVKTLGVSSYYSVKGTYDGTSWTFASSV